MEAERLSCREREILRDRKDFAELEPGSAGTA
jgi:hypothetical protein